jgi:hypothetical protein
MIIGQAYALTMQAVEVGGLQDRVPMHGQFRVALVIRHDDQDVGLGAQANRQKEKW